jgi:COP9 signalosome complex subunit 4
MPSDFVNSELAKLEDNSAPQSAKSSGYNDLLEKIISSPEIAENLTAFIKSVLSESLGIVAARPLLTSSVDAIRNIQDLDERIETGKHVLQFLEPRVASFEDQDASLRQILAQAYQANNEFIEAAKVLQGIQLESSQRRVFDKDKLDHWITICRLYIEEDDMTSAESYLNRAKAIRHNVDDQELGLKFQLSQARILDSRREFLDASQAYHTVSLSPVLAEEDRNVSLSQAIICAVLAGAGPPRSRLLGKLYKDERSAQLEEYGMLEKMFLDRLISPDEVEKFAGKLAPHQLAHTADGSTVLSKAVIEHNLLGASKLYSNLDIKELGALLGLDADIAEEYARRMLEQKRLVGTIDQIDEVLYFGDQQDGISGGALRDWDRQVRGLVEDVERVASLLQSEIPV